MRYILLITLALSLPSFATCPKRFTYWAIPSGWIFSIDINRDTNSYLLGSEVSNPLTVCGESSEYYCFETSPLSEEKITSLFFAVPKLIHNQDSWEVSGRRYSVIKNNRNDFEKFLPIFILGEKYGDYLIESRKSKKEVINYWYSLDRGLTAIAIYHDTGETTLDSETFTKSVPILKLKNFLTLADDIGFGSIVSAQ